MATICSTRSLISLPRLIFFRLLNNRFQLSTFKHFSSKSTTPVKYTTNKAAKLQIAHTIGIKREAPKEEEEKDPGFHRIITLVSLLVFLTYFCILREENDIDEILKGNEDFKPKERQLYDLKIKLIYCEQNKLPTDALKAKIQELEVEKPIKSPFLK